MEALPERRVAIPGAGSGFQAIPDLEGPALETSEASGQMGAGTTHDAWDPEAALHG
jgi:hypothetical protein